MKWKRLRLLILINSAICLSFLIVFTAVWIYSIYRIGYPFFLMAEPIRLVWFAETMILLVGIFLTLIIVNEVGFHRNSVPKETEE